MRKALRYLTWLGAGAGVGSLILISLAWAQGTAFTPNPMAPTQDAAYDLGQAARRFRTLYLSGVAGTGGLRVVQTTPPTCSTNCGTDPSIVGSDSAMVVTMGSGSPASPFTVTFTGTYGAAPSCTAARRTGTAANVVQVVETTTTTVVVTVATAVGASTLFSINCNAVS